ncbi:hypothetical protein NL676_035290 [Syzygium grande]|nr:hypothetical protein NL676_035290 [Syzygium grande]
MRALNRLSAGEFEGDRARGDSDDRKAGDPTGDPRSGAESGDLGLGASASRRAMAVPCRHLARAAHVSGEWGPGGGRLYGTAGRRRASPPPPPPAAAAASASRCSHLTVVFCGCVAGPGP